MAAGFPATRRCAADDHGADVFAGKGSPTTPTLDEATERRQRRGSDAVAALRRQRRRAVGGSPRSPSRQPVRRFGAPDKARDDDGARQRLPADRRSSADTDSSARLQRAPSERRDEGRLRRLAAETRRAAAGEDDAARQLRRVPTAAAGPTGGGQPAERQVGRDDDGDHNNNARPLRRYLSEVRRSEDRGNDARARPADETERAVRHRRSSISTDVPDRRADALADRRACSTTPRGGRADRRLLQRTPSYDRVDLQARVASQPRLEGLRIALYDDHGGSSSKTGVPNVRGAADFERILRQNQWTSTNGRPFLCHRLTASAIRDGALAKGGFAALVHPGGEGCAQGRALREEGMENIRRFVARGGGYVGICAGANLASSDPNYGSHTLGLLPTITLDTTDEYPSVKYLRGQGIVDVELSAAGQETFGTQRCVVSVDYINGPLIGQLRREDALVQDPLRPERCVTLATYAGEIAASKYGRYCRNCGPSRGMTGRTAAVAGVYGQGRVVCIGPHPEKISGPQWMLRNSVAWVTKRPAVPAARSASSCTLSAPRTDAKVSLPLRQVAARAQPADSVRAADRWPSSDEEEEEEEGDESEDRSSIGPYSPAVTLLQAAGRVRQARVHRTSRLLPQSAAALSRRGSTSKAAPRGRVPHQPSPPTPLSPTSSCQRRLTSFPADRRQYAGTAAPAR
eukprot:TRINITY_DN300_c4_g2_i3.p1 TRINITY_DN300_c4_g2~~TRINITY_DN300_c4_g2_i3.p1  ORF type:complete len:703 (+),score=196.78 TRINITY_DN300_c4_g2_i3:51-2111(+)